MTAKATPELAGCPFCAQKKAFTGQTLDSRDRWYATCSRDQCAFVGYFDTEAEAITAWNTRPTSAAEMRETAAKVAEEYPHGHSKPIGESIAKRIRALPVNEATGEVERLRVALRAVRADIMNENGLNSQSIACTIWHGPAETTVDLIDATLGDRP